jgi:hypothetical protein
MIETYDSSSPVVRNGALGLDAMDLTSSVQLTVARDRNGLYRVALSRMRLEPMLLEGLELGTVNDVPPGQRRATWLLTDAVQLALSNPEAHRLLHW